MGFKKRLYEILLICCMMAGVYYVGKSGIPLTEQKEREEQESFLSRKKDTIQFWYTDESLTDYIEGAAVDFYEKNDIRVEPYLASSQEFLEAVYEASLSEEQAVPDLYLITNDCLEKAYLSGLAMVADDGGILHEENFGLGALHAVTYQDKYVGYPFYYETSVLLYNDTYLMENAEKRLQAELDQQMAEQSQAQAEAGNVEEEAKSQQETVFSEEEIRAKMEEMLPSTIEQLEQFADEYDAPEQVEGVFRWDVSDILYNFNFAGHYMSVGGESGDKKELTDIYNLETLECMTVFQKLNQFFFIETKDVSYDSVVQDFMDGKIVFTVAGTDILGKLEAAKTDGTLQYEYGLREMPELNDHLMSKSRSITTVVAVNGFSEQKKIANQFAKFLTTEYADNLYSRTGKMPSYRHAVTDVKGADVFYAEYEDSVPMPKMMEAGNFWIKLEIAFTDIWEGADVNATLKALSEEFMTQITGDAYEEEYIELPQEEEEEYIDESEETAEE